MKRFKKRQKINCHLSNNLLKNNKIDIAYIDYHYYGQYINYFKSKKFLSFMEHIMFSQDFLCKDLSVSLKNKFSNILDFLINQIHERYYFKKADAIIAVSENDYQYYKNYINSNKIYIIPNFLVEQDYSNSSNK